MTLSAALLEHWVFGAFLCKFVNFTPTLTALVSTFTVATISVERWFFIVNKRKFHRRCTILALVLLWIVSILIALPEFISRHIEEFAPPPIPLSILKTGSAALDTIHNYNNTNLSTENETKTLCHMKKIYFCVLDPGLRMRIFSYIVMTVQYLVPFLFVSISCYSISRFLKRRMKQMRIYQTHRSGNRTKAHDERQKASKVSHQQSNLDGKTKGKCADYDESSITADATKNKSNHLLIRMRNIFKNSDRDQNSIDLDHSDSLTTRDIHHELIPKVKVQSHSERRFHRSRKLLICVAALFTISWLPLTVVQLYLEHNEEITRDEPNFVYAFLLIPCYLISSLSAWMNPVIYNYINRSFRREFYALYPCCFKVTSPVSSVSLAETKPEINVLDSERFQRRGLSGTQNANDLKTRSKHTFGPSIVVLADGKAKVKSTIEINDPV